METNEELRQEIAELKEERQYLRGFIDQVLGRKPEFVRIQERTRDYEQLKREYRGGQRY
jgi:hypothetical protein